MNWCITVLTVTLVLVPACDSIASLANGALKPHGKSKVTIQERFKKFCKKNPDYCVFLDEDSPVNNLISDNVDEISEIDDDFKPDSFIRVHDEVKENLVNREERKQEFKDGLISTRTYHNSGIIPNYRQALKRAVKELRDHKRENDISKSTIFQSDGFKMDVEAIRNRITRRRNNLRRLSREMETVNEMYRSLMKNDKKN